jgi:hypothetical protein
MGELFLGISLTVGLRCYPIDTRKPAKVNTTALRSSIDQITRNHKVLSGSSLGNQHNRRLGKTTDLGGIGLSNGFFRKKRRRELT